MEEHWFYEVSSLYPWLANNSEGRKQEKMRSQQNSAHYCRGHTASKKDSENENEEREKGSSINHRYAQHYREART